MNLVAAEDCDKSMTIGYCGSMDYQYLDSKHIAATVSTLQKRITERFPDSGLSKVCAQLSDIADNAVTTSEHIRKPMTWLRVLIWIGCVLFLVLTIGAIYIAIHSKDSLLANIDAEANVLVLLGGAMLFLWTLEIRYKRGRALKAIHELRSMAHIVDMHQLTKNPEKLLAKKIHRTDSSPTMTMTAFELRRYLDYCSEMLSLIGKIAAVYVQSFDDPVTVASASDVETLTTGLTQKIWQKILILNPIRDEDPPSSKIQVS